MIVLLKRQGAVVVLTLGLFVGGCNKAAIKPTLNVTPEPPLIPVEEAVSRLQRSVAKVVMLNQLLEQAEQALKHRRLTAPSHDNAYDKYQAALLVDKDNRVAKSGLDAVLLDLSGLAREYLAKGQLTRAQGQLDTLQEYFPKAQLTENLHVELARAYESAAAQRLLNEASTSDSPDKHRIPVKFIRSDTQDALEWYKALAETIKETDSGVLIHARSDAEGRWIYKALRKPVPGYLVRGDIRISKVASIQLLEPL